MLYCVLYISNYVHYKERGLNYLVVPIRHSVSVINVSGRTHSKAFKKKAIGFSFTITFRQLSITFVNKTLEYKAIV